MTDNNLTSKRYTDMLGMNSTARRAVLLMQAFAYRNRLDLHDAMCCLVPEVPRATNPSLVFETAKHRIRGLVTQFNGNRLVRRGKDRECSINFTELLRVFSRAFDNNKVNVIEGMAKTGKLKMVLDWEVRNGARQWLAEALVFRSHSMFATLFDNGFRLRENMVADQWFGKFALLLACVTTRESFESFRMLVARHPAPLVEYMLIPLGVLDGTLRDEALIGDVESLLPFIGFFDAYLPVQEKQRDLLPSITDITPTVVDDSQASNDQDEEEQPNEKRADALPPVIEPVPVVVDNLPEPDEQPKEDEPDKLRGPAAVAAVVSAPISEIANAKEDNEEDEDRPGKRLYSRSWRRTGDDEEESLGDGSGDDSETETPTGTRKVNGYEADDFVVRDNEDYIESESEDSPFQPPDNEENSESASAPLQSGDGSVTKNREKRKRKDDDDESKSEQKDSGEDADEAYEPTAEVADDEVDERSLLLRQRSSNRIEAVERNRQSRDQHRKTAGITVDFSDFVRKVKYDYDFEGVPMPDIAELGGRLSMTNFALWINKPRTQWSSTVFFSEICTRLELVVNSIGQGTRSKSNMWLLTRLALTGRLDVMTRAATHNANGNERCFLCLGTRCGLPWTILEPNLHGCSFAEECVEVGLGSREKKKIGSVHAGVTCGARFVNAAQTLVLLWQANKYRYPGDNLKKYKCIMSTLDAATRACDDRRKQPLFSEYAGPSSGRAPHWKLHSNIPSNGSTTPENQEQTVEKV
jgi:hypothetical protein